MSTNLNYTSLVADIGAYLEKGRTPGTAAYDQIPRIINLAERSIVTELKLQGYERTLRGQLQIGKTIYEKPDRWRETVSMHIEVSGRLQPLFARSYEYCRSFWPDDNEHTIPKFYAEYEATHYFICGTPGENYYWELKAYFLPKLLGEERQTNWLTEQAPSALLMRCLKEMAVFIKNQEDVTRFTQEYVAAIGALSGQDAKKLMDRASERDGV